ncbi:ALP1-like protein isoform X1 [Tanacetum coccineum]
MDPNQSDDERNNFSEVDDETDIWFMMQACEYDRRLQEEQNRPRITRNPINRDREDAKIRLMEDYFDELCIESCEVDPLPKHFHLFTHRLDATDRMNMSVIMKCTLVIRQLAYDNTPDAFDEYLQMGEHTVCDCLDNFNKCIIDLCMSKYLRKPTLEDVEKIYEAHENIHGFSVDANNDINVLDNSPLFDDILNDIAPVAPYVVNGVGFENGYYLADGIYPQWAVFVKSFTVANDEKHSYFKKRQEGARKNVERAFGVLQGQDQKMVFDDWNDMYANLARNMQRKWIERCDVQRRKAKEILDKEVHLHLQRNLMKHIWQNRDDEDE